MKIVFTAFLIFIVLGSLSAQSFIAQINPYPSVNDNASAVDTIKILAIMLSFQEDRDGTTFGNGKFGSIYSENYGTDILDPLPHDQSYFESHLQFVQNYFEKVSKNNLHIEFTVLPDTFSVSQRMREYSPDPGSEDFTPIADFSVEAWTIADGLYPGFDFSSYDLFTIFHAGVGRDVSLPGSIGNERDLPSVYLSDKAFKEIYGSTYEGIPVSGGSFNIKNTMIIPETESRELNTITGTFLFEITINGLMCASVASHLGLPDLFDTETGLSAIGRFGLMDGQGIFAYAGTYPPEPSPWSKINMGWVEPVTLEIENANVNLVTNLAAGIGDTVILKIPLNSSEYYLVENRNRDANNDGSIVTYNVNGSVLTRTFFNDTTGYQSFDVDSLSGVVTDVDEFDWAVPGNGILIWHIDENVINEKLAENKINTDKDRRGVDIEEADGVQDIGEIFITILGDEVIGEGTEEDMWHANNSTELFENRFAKDTRPSTLTNSGANSLITIKDFSEISNKMSFNVEFGDSIVKPLFSFEDIGLQLTTSISLAASTQEIRFWFEQSGSSELINYEGFVGFLPNFSLYKTPSILLEDVSYTYGTKWNRFRAMIMEGTNSFVGTVDLEANIYCPPVIRENINSEYEVLVGTNSGQIVIFDLGRLPSTDPQLKNTFEFDLNIVVKQIASSNSYFSFIADSSLSAADPLFYDSDGNSYSFNGENPTYLALTKNSEGDIINVILTNKNKFHLLSNGTELSSFSLAGGNSISSFSLTDLKQDGINYIVVNNGNNIEVFNMNGTMADNFPFTDPQGIGFVGTPLTADFEGDNNSEIISVTEDGRIFAIDGGSGKIIPGFPISVGTSISVTPVLYNADGKTNLAALNDQGVFAGWSISSVEGKLYWFEEFGNPQNTSFIDAAENTNRINEFFPSGRAYNYPNPVYDGKTFIRYYVSEDSRINIKIFDLAGDYVAELNDDAQGGMDNETTWSVTDIQSGVYLARIEATNSSGKTEQAIIKIAVVK
jgi:hypothetical protein